MAAPAARSRATVGQRLIRRLAQALLALFYRRVEIVGAERLAIPGPLIVAANHHNALVDPLLVLAASPRPLVPLAKAPLFRYPAIGALLGLAGAIPVERREDTAGQPARNESMFRAATDTLAGDGAILIFPEGVSQAEPALMPLRTGTARILLGAGPDVAARVTLLPVGLTFHEPGRFRTGWALVLAGRPVETADCVRLHAAAPEEAVRRLTDRLAGALRALIVEVGDRDTLRLVEAAEAIWRAEGPGGIRGTAARAEWRRRAAAAYRYLRDREPERLLAVRTALERYAKDIDAAGFTEPLLSESFRPGAVLRYAVRQSLSLVLGLPLAIWGIVNHGLPYWLTAVAVRRLDPDPDAQATYKLIAGLVLYPLLWIGEGWTAWRLGGGWLLAAFIAGLAPSAFFALAWSERLGQAARDTRAWASFLADRDVHRHLRERRRDIMRDLGALLDLVPESAMSDRPEARP